VADDPSKNGTYVCVYNNSRTVTLDNYVKLAIDIDELVKPEFVCMVKKNYQQLSCEWSSIDAGQLVSRWTLTYRERSAMHCRFTDQFLDRPMMLRFCFLSCDV